MNSKAIDDISLMTAEEVSRFLRIPLVSVYHLTRKGEVKGVKIGKHWRYQKDHILQLINRPFRHESGEEHE